MCKPKLVGILNITPDSFSDGGAYIDPQKAIEHAIQLANDGADVIDIGAESTRPGATPLTAEQEWQRLAPLLCELVNHFKATPTLLSLDSRHPANVEKALALGIDWVNDVSGGDDEAMLKLVKHAPDHVKFVFMHHLGIPADKSRVIAANENVVDVVKQWAERKMIHFERMGIAKERLIFDVGIGFGKTAEQSLALIAHLAAFKALGVALYVGHSRKSFLNPYCDHSISAKDEGTLVTSLYLAQQGVDYIRIHNVAMHQSAFALQEAFHKATA